MESNGEWNDLDEELTKKYVCKRSDECIDIDNCDQVCCTTSSDHYCEGECDYDYGCPNSTDWTTCERAYDLVRQDGYERRYCQDDLVLDSGHIECSSNYTQENPNKGMHDCTERDYTNVILQHGDRFVVTARSINGGRIDISNKDDIDNIVVDRYYYNGNGVDGTVVFVVDLDKPYHCSENSNCNDNMLDVGDPYTTNENLSVTWSGWIDDASGLNGFHWQIYLLVATNSNELNYVYPALDEGYYDAHSVGCNVSLPNAGVYCVLLTVDDVAGSYCIARRFITFDNENVVKIHDKESPIVVESAITNPSNNDIWQTDLQDKHHNGNQVHIVWNDHFRNTHHDLNSYLGSIAAHVPDIPEPYEEKTGQPPTIRSREAIPGVNGIAKTETVYAVDHQGGESIIEPPDLWSDVPNFPIEEQYFDIERVDGDSVRVWIQSYDIIGNSAVDEVLIHVDSSPPNIFDVELTEDKVHQLAVNDSIGRYYMHVTFRTFDQHSGLFDIKWELRDMAEITEIIASGTVAVQKQDGECESKSCICIPKGECYETQYAIHLDDKFLNSDCDYIISIIVRNNAFLVSSVNFQNSRHLLSLAFWC
uniref:Uncharacterized protein LOC102805061 n=1 Tax=Saccoglossus kowalevskii TaxID=10224 RepID=A0ABM0MJ46_SACKO|nr:PREDICTED: uncharacterized protein LOC102805061 [Saccoglossus kowalevskii]